MRNFKEAQRIVVKVGSSTLTHSTGLINLRRVEMLVKVLADLKNAGKEIVLVSSGAVSVGVGKLSLKERPKTIPAKQAVAAVGQCELMYIYDKFFGEYNHKVGQMLLTRDIVENDNYRQNVVNTFENLFDYNVIPVINENDTVAIDELVIGDNDSLSAMVSTIVKADLLIVMSDVDGLYTDNPSKNPDAKLIDTVEEITDYIKSIAGAAGSVHGTGGMATKITAAEIAGAEGIDMLIVSGEDPNVLYDAIEGKNVGTLFVGRGKC